MPRPKPKVTARQPSVTQPPMPVTVTRLAVTRCGTCGSNVRYRPEPGAASAALTGHWQQEIGRAHV